MHALWLDVEVLADREDELQMLAVALAEEDGEGKSEQDAPQQDDDLPPIIQDQRPHVGIRKRPGQDRPVSLADKPERPSESILRGIRRMAERIKNED